MLQKRIVCTNVDSYLCCENLYIVPRGVNPGDFRICGESES